MWGRGFETVAIEYSGVCVKTGRRAAGEIAATGRNVCCYLAGHVDVFIVRQIKQLDDVLEV